MMDGILYFVDAGKDSNLWIVVPVAKEADGRDACWKSCWAFYCVRSLYNTLSWVCWWKGMYGGVHQFCCSCLTCSSHGGTSHRHKAPLQPLPASGPFDRVGVDILEKNIQQQDHYELSSKSMT